MIADSPDVRPLTGPVAAAHLEPLYSLGVWLEVRKRNSALVALGRPIVRTVAVSAFTLLLGSVVVPVVFVRGVQLDHGAWPYVVIALAVSALLLIASFVAVWVAQDLSVVPVHRFTSDDAGDELRLSIRAEEPHRLAGKALILLVLVRVHNRSARRIAIYGLAKTFDTDGRTDQLGNLDVRHEEDRLLSDRPRLPRVVEPHSHNEGWTAIPFPPFDGVEPGYRIWTEDEFRHKYGIERQRRG